MKLASILNCDLAILAYQLYHQATVWPLDPWYEILAHPGSDRRTAAMRAIHQNLPGVTSIDHSGHYSGPATLRARGVSNTNLDPIITRFEAMDPWSPVWNGDGSHFVGIKTPGYIVDSIARIRAVVFDGSKTKVLDIRERQGGAGTDELIVFEGVSGSRGAQEGSFSPMGFVLRRMRADKTWDAHIAFRGSRSGNALRAAFQGLMSSATGNPDWLTDLDMAVSHHETIGGEVAKGFATTITGCLPTILAALKAVGEGLEAPRSVQITGHSLGAALACLCVDALSTRLPWQTPVPIHGFFMALPPVGSKAYCDSYDKRFGSRTVAPYIAGDLVVEVSKTVGFHDAKIHSGLLQNFSNWSPNILDRMPRPDHALTDENSHEIYLIRSGLLQRAKHLPVEITLDEEMAKATPWAQYASFQSLLNGTSDSSRPAAAEAPNFFTLEVVRQGLVRSRFAAHFCEFLKIFQAVVTTSDSYRGLHWASTRDQAGERIAMALGLRDDLNQAQDAGAIDRLATQIAIFMAFDMQKEWTWSGRVPVADGNGVALTADTLLGESFNARLGLGLALMVIETRPTIALDVLLKVPEISRCLKITLPDFKAVVPPNTGAIAARG